MDDIICPECGRPNLGEAKKCWYCQTELIYSEIPGEDGKGGKPEDEFTTTGHPEQEEDLPEEEDIPEWLARIRSKIEEEREPEEELPFWKQKDIFGGEKKIEKKSQKVKRTHRSAKTKEENITDDDDREDPLLEDPLNKNDNETEFEDLSNDLPDGFTRL